MSPSRALILSLALVSPVLLVSCGGDDTEVHRTDNNAVRDLSGDWNATDSQETATAMIDQITNAGWYKDFHDKYNRNPSVKVGHVHNRTQEDITISILTDDIRRSLINSGKVTVVSSNEDTAQARDERRDQDVNASAETRHESFAETGADFLLEGTIGNQNDQQNNNKQKFYSIDMNLTDVKTQVLVWEGNHKITKDVKQKSYN
jgi:uncharacterized protein (TIGR02722 family)